MPLWAARRRGSIRGARPGVERRSCLLAGRRSKEIARRLSSAAGTVKNHGSAILDKLQAANRTQAALVAREAGLI